MVLSNRDQVRADENSFVRDPQFKQFMLIGGDAGMGHFFYKVIALPFACAHFVTLALARRCAHTAPKSSHRRAEMVGLSRLLCAIEGPGGMYARTILYPVRFERK